MVDVASFPPQSHREYRLAKGDILRVDEVPLFSAFCPPLFPSARSTSPYSIRAMLPLMDQIGRASWRERVSFIV